MTKEELVEALEPYDDGTDIKLAVDFSSDDLETVAINDEGDIVLGN